MTDGSSPICLALDAGDPVWARKVAEATAEYVGVIKIGLTGLTWCGPSLVRELTGLRPIFVDLKLHDIPVQVRGAVAGIADMGASYTTVHALGGPKMIEAASESKGDDLAILAVTVLTSLDSSDLEDLGISGSPSQAVLRLAEIAIEAGADGLVCSPREVAMLRERFGTRAEGGPLMVVPGIRPGGAATDDQARTDTPRAALDGGADLLVIGRPITVAPEPAGAARAILEEIRGQ